LLDHWRRELDAMARDPAVQSDTRAKSPRAESRRDRLLTSIGRLSVCIAQLRTVLDGIP
jgi:hypothetical protein